jgi:hypothetical protein
MRLRGRVGMVGVLGCVLAEEVAMELRKLSLHLRPLRLARQHPSTIEAGATRATPWHDDQAGALCLRPSTAASISIMEGLYYNVKYGYDICPCPRCAHI